MPSADSHLLALITIWIDEPPHLEFTAYEAIHHYHTSLAHVALFSVPLFEQQRVRASSDSVLMQELIFQVCPNLILGGMLPWNCSITQYSHLGNLSSVTHWKIQQVLYLQTHVV